MVTPIIATTCLLCKDRGFFVPTSTSTKLYYDYTGQCFGRLDVQHLFGMRQGRAYWCCLCVCGIPAIITGADLRRGRNQSCICLTGKASKKAKTFHGQSETKLYRRWRSMVRRCTSPIFPEFPRYGGRGITVCPRWLTSFTDFVADMGEPPPGASIERRDNDGSYSPENCYWGTPVDQANNRRSSRLLTYNGEAQTLAQWARKLGIHYGTLHGRIKNGWTIVEILTTPVDCRYSHPAAAARRHRLRIAGRVIENENGAENHANG